MKGTPNSLYWEEPEDPLDIVPCPFVIFVHTFTVAFSEVLGLFFFFLQLGHNSTCTTDPMLLSAAYFRVTLGAAEW